MTTFYEYALPDKDGAMDYTFNVSLVNNPKYHSGKSSMAFWSDLPISDAEGLVEITELDYDNFDKDPSQLEQSLLNKLIPSKEEIEKAEFELKVLNLLTEVGLV